MKTIGTLVAVIMLISCSKKDAATAPSYQVYAISNNSIELRGTNLAQVKSVSTQEKDNVDNQTDHTIVSQTDTSIVVQPKKDYELVAGHVYSVATQKQDGSSDNVDVEITVTGLAKCAAGFTLIGKKGKGAFCISTDPETAQTFWDSIETCRAKDPTAQMCSPQEWYFACKDGGPNGMDILSKRSDYNADHPFVHGEKTATFTSEGDAIMIENESGDCRRVAPDSVSTVAPFRCCYR